MCIAIAKMKGQSLPSDNILKNCFENNPDGGGFAFNHNGQVFIKKGYMKWDDFINALHSADKKYHLKDKGVLIHTRISTHGGTNPEMTHPFPIIADEGILKKTENISPYAVIHNGVITLTSSEATRRKTVSDTAVFVEKYLTKIASNKDWFDNDANIELIEDLIDSKMAILNGDGDIVMTSGFTADNGIYYSNTSYMDSYTRVKKATKYYYNYSYPYSDYDNYDDYDEYYGYTKNYQGYSTPKHTFKKYVSLMKLKPDEAIDTKDGFLEYFSPEYDFFVDSKGNGYISDTKTDCSFYLNTDITFFADDCEIIKADGRTVEFHCNYMTNNTKITNWDDVPHYEEDKKLVSYYTDVSSKKKDDNTVVVKKLT